MKESKESSHRTRCSSLSYDISAFKQKFAQQIRPVAAVGLALLLHFVRLVVLKLSVKGGLLFILFQPDSIYLIFIIFRCSRLFVTKTARLFAILCCSDVL